MRPPLTDGPKTTKFGGWGHLVGQNQSPLGNIRFHFDFNEILGSKRKDRFSTLFLALLQNTRLRVKNWNWNCTKHLFGSFFIPALPLQFLSGPAGHAKDPAEVPEYSWALNVRRLWFPTSDRFKTWLIPFSKNWSRQHCEST